MTEHLVRLAAQFLEQIQRAFASADPLLTSACLKLVLVDASRCHAIHSTATNPQASAP